MTEIAVGPPPPRSHARLWVSTLLLAVYTAFVLVVTMWPSPQDLEFDSIASRVLRALHNVGVPEWFGYDKLEFTANIAMFVPLGFLLGLALARRAWWVALFLLPAFSGLIEYTQGVALESRVSTFYDVLANTIGGYLGLLLAMVIRAMIHQRDRTMIERELWERRRVAARFSGRRRRVLRCVSRFRRRQRGRLGMPWRMRSRIRLRACWTQTSGARARNQAVTEDKASQASTQSRRGRRGRVMR